MIVSQLRQQLIDQIGSSWDVDQLLMHVYGWSKAELLMALSLSVDETVLGDAAVRLENGEPLAYVLGELEFMGRRYAVCPGVLIPRPETEEVILKAVDLIRDKGWETGTILELGFGSGVISLELARRFPGFQVMGWDVSQVAVDVAKQNCDCSNVSFQLGDFFEHVGEVSVDKPVVIVSNPPYIAHSEISGLDRSVRDFEPMEALDGGDDGLDFYRRLVEVYDSVGDLMVCEIGFDQGDAIRELGGQVFADINGKDRIGVWGRFVG